MDLAVAGHLGQHPLRPEPQGQATSASSPSYDRDEFEFDRDGLEEFLAREGRREPIEQVDLAPAARVPRATTGAAARWPAGSTTSSAWRSTRPRGRACQGRGHPPAPGRGPRALRPQGGRVPRPGRHDPVPRRAHARPGPPATTATAWPPGPRERFHTLDRPRGAAAHAPARDRGAPARARPQALPGARGSPRSSSAGSRPPIGPARRRRQAGPAPDAGGAAPTWPPGPGRSSASRRPPTSCRDARPRRGPRHCWSTPSTPSTGPRCARWRRSSSSRSSTRAGWNTSARWTTSAARSACRAMPRSTRRSSTSARG